MKRTPAPARTALIAFAALPLLALAPASRPPQTDGRTRLAVSVRSTPGPTAGRDRGARRAGSGVVTAVSADRIANAAGGRLLGARDRSSAVPAPSRTPLAWARPSAGGFDGIAWALVAGPFALGVSGVVWSLRPPSRRRAAGPALPGRAARAGHRRTQRSDTPVPARTSLSGTPSGHGCP